MFLSMQCTVSKWTQNGHECSLVRSLCANACVHLYVCSFLFIQGLVHKEPSNVCCSNFCLTSRRVKQKVVDVMPKFSAGDPKRPPTPPTPQYCSLWDEKGTILPHFNFCIHTYQDMQLKWCRVMGQKLRYGRPCTHDLPSTHNWLTQPHIASFLQISTKYLMLTSYPGSLEWIAAPLAWLTPRPAPKRVCLWLVGLSTDHPFSLISS